MGILDGGVPPCSPNPDPISDQKMSFSTPVLRPDLKNPYHSRFQTKKAQKPYQRRAAHTYMAYTREYSPPPGFQVLLKGLCHEDIAALGQFCAEVRSFCLLPLHKILL